MTAAVVITLLVVLPLLKACRWLAGSWLAALSPIWVAYGIVAWTLILSWLELSTNLGLMIWAPAAAGLLAFMVAWIQALSDADNEHDLEVARPFGAGGLGDRILQLVDDEDAIL